MPKRNVKSSLKTLFIGTILILTLFCSGCGSAVHYRLPTGKTLIYEVSSVIESEEKDKGENTRLVPTEGTRKTIDLRVKPTNIISGNYSVIVSAQPTGKDRHYAVGRDLGSLNVVLARNGKIVRAYGLGLPVDIRLIFRELPGKKMKRGAGWSEPIKSDVLGEGIGLKLISRYEGWASVNGRSCHHIHSAAKYNYGEKYRYEQMDVKLKINYSREEDFYILPAGYPIRTEVMETKKLVLEHLYTGEKLFEKDENLKTELNLVGME